ncbi:3-deoxy-D-manno-octulosonic acid transferase [Parasulfitobacter algicola]|uniref:3-deoxy-D-manno-octulosonic acid transferase n=1 Tax=Parasulfitobacter algicola TaxID=2614809 RepID=A0ABX2ILL8_9RHOB|nr:glycosyltransferase N-terminal domain-containing protein [Sulfitobacter algicola]NSX53776.1 3-deoxy-D-manno-octulosonic acid transferase [Sulfitobacter algicola]
MSTSDGMFLYRTLTDSEPSDETPRKHKPDSPLVWLHASNLADAMAICELAERLRHERDDLFIMLTTPPTLELPSDRRLASVFCQTLPNDTGHGSAEYLEYWKPDLLIWADGDLHHGLLSRMSERNIPMFLINVRLSSIETSGLRWALGMHQKTFRHFDRIFVVDEEVENHIRRMGAEAQHIEVSQLLEEGTPALSCDKTEHAHLTDILGSRPMWLAAMVSQEEVEVIGQAHRRASRTAHRLLLILVPDDETQGLEIAQTLAHKGWEVALRSKGEDPTETTQIFVADTPDEMGIWYRLAPITFLGCSLIHGPGKNPFEPAALGSAVLHGPNVSQYRSSYDRLAKAGATRSVRNGDQLATAVEDLLSPHLAAKLAHAAWDVTSGSAEVTDRIVEMALTALDDRGL